MMRYGLIGFALFVLLLLFYVISAYNRLVRGRNNVEEAWSGIDVQLKRRHDLIPNIVSTVQGYASHEKGVFEAVTQARAGTMNVPAGDVAGTAKAENALTQTLRSLFAVAEAYPELKANENFVHLQNTLDQLESEIQMARRYYNGVVRMQNNAVQSFPSNLIASRYGFEKCAYFELDDAAEKAVPQVDYWRRKIKLIRIREKQGKHD